jgi:hypothetical protein
MDRCTCGVDIFSWKSWHSWSLFSGCLRSKCDTEIGYLWLEWFREQNVSCCQVWYVSLLLHLGITLPLCTTFSQWRWYKPDQSHKQKNLVYKKYHLQFLWWSWATHHWTIELNCEAECRDFPSPTALWRWVVDLNTLQSTSLCLDAV